MTGENFFNAFDFNDQFFFNQKVDVIVAIQLYAFISDQHWPLSCKPDPDHTQFINQTLFITGFAQTGTQVLMHFPGTRDDPVGQSIEFAVSKRGHCVFQYISRIQSTDSQEITQRDFSRRDAKPQKNG
jgi:hypothetical protein